MIKAPFRITWVYIIGAVSWCGKSTLSLIDERLVPMLTVWSLRVYLWLVIRSMLAWTSSTPKIRNQMRATSICMTCLRSSSIFNIARTRMWANIRPVAGRSLLMCFMVYQRPFARIPLQRRAINLPVGRYIFPVRIYGVIRMMPEISNGVRKGSSLPGIRKISTGISRMWAKQLSPARRCSSVPTGLQQTISMYSSTIIPAVAELWLCSRLSMAPRPKCLRVPLPSPAVLSRGGRFIIQTPVCGYIRCRTAQTQPGTRRAKHLPVMWSGCIPTARPLPVPFMPDSIWYFLPSGMNLSSTMMPTVPMCIRVMLRRPHLLCMVVPIQCKNTKQMKHRKGERLKVIVSTESNWTNGVIRAKQTHHKPPGLRKAM